MNCCFNCGSVENIKKRPPNNGVQYSFILPTCEACSSNGHFHCRIQMKRGTSSSELMQRDKRPRVEEEEEEVESGNEE